ncbi:MAG: DUF1702 family protein, partial [Ferruginibacter sp.]
MTIEPFSIHPMHNVLHKIETIKSIFLNSQAFYEMNNDINMFLEFLENIEPEFRSIGYEAASMVIALSDLNNYKNLKAFLLFAKGPALAHAAQVHVGLGWAIAKMKLPFLPVVEKIDDQFYYRIADGCGYYDGFFRNRHAVINQQLPVYMPIESMHFYYQGIGRSLWYSCNAEIEKVRSNIEIFPADLHADLWRGVGIAVAYVGGCDADTLKIIFEFAKLHQEQLTNGAALAARSRMEAGTITSDTTLCSQLWFKLCCEANIISLDSTAADTEDVYLNWISKTEN